MGKPTTIGMRMKEYERVTQAHLSRRVPVIIRVDGKAFHTLCKGLDKPFDAGFIDSMEAAATAERQVVALREQQDSSKLQGQLKEYQAILDGVDQALEHPDKKPMDYRIVQKVRNLVLEFRDVTRSYGKATADLQRVRGEREGAKKAVCSDNTAQSRKAIDKLFKDLEWAGKHSSFTYRGSGKPIPCCPACEGLNPHKLDSSDPDVGHTSKCWFKALHRNIQRIMK